MQALIFNQSQGQAADLAAICKRYELSPHCHSELVAGNLVACNQPCKQSRILFVDDTLLQQETTLVASLAASLPQDTIAVTCADASVNYTVQLMNAGAAWVFADWSDSAVVDAGFRSLIKATQRLNEEFTQHQRLQEIKRTIAKREWQVIEMVLRGMPNKQIAKQLDISLRTVEARRSQVYHKCHVTTPQELVRCLDLAARLEAKFAAPIETPVRLPHQAVARQHLRTSDIASLA